VSSKKDKKVFLFFLKKCLQFSNDSGRLFSVMRDRIELEEVFVSEESPVLVSCCGCGNEEHISREAADQWTDIDRFQCHECE
jgi:hypothetical protein